MYIRGAYCIVLLVCLCIIHIHIHYPYCIFLYVYASRCYGLRLSVFDKETTYLITYLLTSCRSTLDLQVRRLKGMLRPLRWPVLTVVVYRSLNGHIDLWRVSAWTMWHERMYHQCECPDVDVDWSMWTTGRGLWWARMLRWSTACWPETVYVSSSSTPSSWPASRSVRVIIYLSPYSYQTSRPKGTIRYDTIVEFNVYSKAEYSALSSTRSQKKYKKKKLKQTNASGPLIQYRLRSVKALRQE